MALYWHYDLMQNYDLKILGCTEMFMNIAVCIAIECSADSSTKFSSQGGAKLRVFQDRIKSPNLAPSRLKNLVPWLAHEAVNNDVECL